MQYLLTYQDWVNESLKSWDLNQVEPINEGSGWLSTALHLTADIAAAISDVVVVGSGSVIDFLNALAYWIEAAFITANDEDSQNTKLELIICGFIQIAAMFAIGPIQAAIVKLKDSIKSLFGWMKTGLTGLTAAQKASIGTLANSARAAITEIIGIITTIGTKIKGAIKPGGWAEKAVKWICEKVKLGTGNPSSMLADAEKWIDEKLLAVKPALEKFLNKLTIFDPHKWLGVTAAHGAAEESEEFAAKTVAKATARATATWEAGGTIANTIANTKAEAASWLKDEKAKMIAPSDAYSGMTSQMKQQAAFQMQSLKPAQSSDGGFQLGQIR